MVIPITDMETETPPSKVPESNVIVIKGPTMETIPLRAGFPGGENSTSVLVLLRKFPTKVTTIWPLTGIGLAGVNSTVIQIPAPSLAGFESVMAGDKGPNELVRTSQTSTWLDTVPVNPPPK